MLVQKEHGRDPYCAGNYWGGDADAVEQRGGDVLYCGGGTVVVR